jgi:hypothetical protein
MVRAMKSWIAILAVTAACGTNARTNVGGDAGGNVDAPANGDATFTDGTVTDLSRVYAHSGTTLYKIDITTLAPTKIADFSGNGTKTITDIAVDKNDKMVGVTLDAVYSIDTTTGVATLLKTLTGTNGFTSLSYVPNNDPTMDDILVAATSGGDVYQIDSAGATTKLGNYGMVNGKQIGSSGDLIGVRGLGIFATVNVGTTAGSKDYLAKVDPTTWAATPLSLDAGYDNIFGLGFWGGKVFGFVDDKVNKTGVIIQIDPNTGAKLNEQGGQIEWYGAGVTTNAPIIQ